MYLLYSDETNLDPSRNLFFIYGGIAVAANNAGALSNKIEEIRQDSNIPSDFRLKFNPGPEHLEHKNFLLLKQRIIKAAVECQCIMLVSIIHHAIATSPDEARRKEINRIAHHFNCLLSRLDEYGLMLIDRFDDRQIDAHLREKFSFGVTGLPYSDVLRLDRVLGFHYSAIGQSHFGSLVDIAIGSFRFAVNAFSLNQARKMNTATHLIALLAPLFYHSTAQEGKVRELNLFFSPKTIKVDLYRKAYQDLKDFLAQNGIDAQQDISEYRQY